MGWLLPESVSTFGPEIDRLYYVILVITGVIFVITQAVLIWFVIKYRHREGRRAEYIHGSTKAEIIWTATPFLILLFLGLYSRGIWAEVKDPARFPADALHIELVAKQFEWNATYPGADGELGTADDFSTRNQLRVPVGRAVQIALQSEDVLHSFFLPDLRVKQDAVPGKVIPVWFEVTRAGEFPIGCAELCGNGHTRMRGTLIAMEEAEYQTWVQSQAADAEDD
jgi:cytochrome c oxidase subunit 2